jgi:ABC-type Zn uptake system ZnuABC Zn-binding protein ZnuA
MRKWFLVLMLGILSVSACAPAQSADDEKIKVVASMSIVADVVKQVGGDAVQVTSLLPVNADPHSFQPTPRDLASLSDADLIFLNGLELESALENVIANANPKQPPVEVSAGITPRELSEAEADFLKRMEESGGATPVEDDHGHGAGDPHVWTDPANVKVWVDVIAGALSQADPSQKETFLANAAAYKLELDALDSWIVSQVELVPPENRQMLSNHLTWGYFAARYGFEQVGAVLPGFSTSSEPSAQEMAALEERIMKLGVQAIFVENTVSPRLAERVSADTGVKVVALFTDSLGGPGSGADTYLTFMRYNVSAIVDALK